jgi:hypothetical protein
MNPMYLLPYFKKWLSSMGMRPDKAGGVEMYCAKHYLEFRDYWGTGGVLLHEFCHAYHFKHCKDGFNNEEVKEVTSVLTIS